MKFLTFLAIVVLSTSSFAQEGALSLDQLINLSIKNNLDLKSSELAVEAQEAIKDTGFELPKTDVTLMYGQYNSIARNDNNITILQNIPLTIFGSQGKFNRTMLEASKLKEVITRNDVIYRVKQVYYQLQSAVARKELYLVEDSIYEGFNRSAIARHRSGEATLLEKTTAEAQRNEIKNKLAKLEGEILNLKTEFKTITNSEAIPEIAVGKIEPIKKDLLQEQSATSTNPGLSYSRNQIDVARQEKKLTGLKAAPELKVGAFTQTLIGTPAENGTPAVSSDRFTGFQVGLAIPLWFAPYASRVKAAGVKYKTALNDHDSYQNALNGKYQQALETYKTNKRSVEYFTTSALPNADLILKQTGISFKSGEISYAEFLLGLRTALTIKESYIDTLNDFNQSIIYIDYLTGNID